ncbi:hypothetical protein QF035_007047 [Streptomyces umbrinus]|uniref:Uncharacterized protein n=1 Tax=Streptomyces umbrinus TaxID=67370 RepID=A0ABU0T0W4_9ACTN|nr:hypothetical protein [Streptomyces umbrinus]
MTTRRLRPRAALSAGTPPWSPVWPGCSTASSRPTRTTAGLVSTPTVSRLIDTLAGAGPRALAAIGRVDPPSDGPGRERLVRVAGTALDVVPARVEAMRSKVKRLMVRGWLIERQPGRFTIAARMSGCGA